jgi:hypothetical protein
VATSPNPTLASGLRVQRVSQATRLQAQIIAAAYRYAVPEPRRSRVARHTLTSDLQGRVFKQARKGMEI